MRCGFVLISSRRDEHPTSNDAADQPAGDNHQPGCAKGVKVSMLMKNSHKKSRNRVDQIRIGFDSSGIGDEKSSKLAEDDLLRTRRLRIMLDDRWYLNGNGNGIEDQTQR